MLWTGRVTPPPPLPPPPFYFGGNKRAPVPPTCQTQSHGSLAGLPPNNLALAPLCLLIPVSGLSRSVIARLPTATTHVLLFFFCSFSHFTIYLFICSSSAASDELDVSEDPCCLAGIEVTGGQSNQETRAVFSASIKQRMVAIVHVNDNQTLTLHVLVVKI